MTFVKVKPSALLVREKSFNTEPVAIPIDGFLTQFEIRDQIDRVFVIRVPPDNSCHRAISL